MNTMKALLAGVAAVFLSVTAQAAVADRIVAVVNGEVITLSEFSNTFAPYGARLEAYQGQDRDKAVADTKMNILNRMVEDLLMEQLARKEKLIPKENEVDAAIKDLLKRRNITDDQLKQALAKDGTTMESYRKGIRNQLMRIRLVQKEIRSKVAISDDEIGTYYLKHHEEYEGKETVRVRQILLAAPQDGDPAVREKQRAEAEAVRARLLNGELFEKLAAQYSQGPMAQGGDIGFIERGMVLPEIEEVAFSLQVNQISAVIESPAGFHILQVTDRRGAGLKAIETVREEIREKLEEEKMEKKFEEWLLELRRKSHVEIKL